MASPASPEASEVRRRGQRRLIGAIAIVLLLVVFVPMVLDDAPRTPDKGPDTTIPPRDKAPSLPTPAAPPTAVAPSPAMKAATPNPARTPSIAAVVPPEAVKAPQEGATAAAEAQHAVVEPVATARKAELLKPELMKPVDATRPAATPKAEVEKAQAAPKLEGFAVQVGAFRDEDRVKAVREKLAAAGVVHYTERLDSPGGPITRLRAGPFPTRAGADAAIAKIRAVAPDAKIVTLP